mmetsp:Transcript_9004/g.19345  ORF Transcript_9004/g.19345 Transcript_9004/m.19345 type:complete len:200 (-) Transcript_9004:100-699(-)
MAQVRPTAPVQHLYAGHVGDAVVRNLDDVLGVDWREERGPAGAAVELGVRVEEGQAAQGAHVNPALLVVMRVSVHSRSCEGALSAMLQGDVLGHAGQALRSLAPLLRCQRRDVIPRLADLARDVSGGGGSPAAGATAATAASRIAHLATTKQLLQIEEGCALQAEFTICARRQAPTVGNGAAGSTRVVDSRVRSVESRA